MTNLVILHAGYQIKNSASVTAATTAGATGYEEEKLLSSDRFTNYKSSSAVTSFSYVLDNTAAISQNYLYIQRADLLARGVENQFCYVTFEADDNSSFTSPDSVTSDFSSLHNLIGPGAEDFILETGFSSTNRYSRLTIGDFSESYVVELGSILCGSWFDAGQEPSYNLSVDHKWQNSSAFKPQREISMSWRKVSKTVKAEFETYIDNYRSISPVTLYDRNDYIFNGDKCVNCMLESVTYKIEPLDLWTIDANFVELI